MPSHTYYFFSTHILFSYNFILIHTIVYQPQRLLCRRFSAKIKLEALFGGTAVVSSVVSYHNTLEILLWSFTTSRESTILTVIFVGMVHTGHASWELKTENVCVCFKRQRSFDQNLLSVAGITWRFLWNSNWNHSDWRCLVNCLHVTWYTVFRYAVLHVPLPFSKQLFYSGVTSAERCKHHMIFQDGVHQERACADQIVILSFYISSFFT